MERALAALTVRLQERGHQALVFAIDAAPGAPGEFHEIRMPRVRRGDRERLLCQTSVMAAGELGCDVTLGIRHVTGVDVYWPHGGLHRATLAAGEASQPWALRGITRLLHRMSGKHRAFLAIEDELLATGLPRRIWCVSSMIRAEIASAYPVCAGRLEEHGNGVDRDLFHPGLRDEYRDGLLHQLGVPPDSPVFLFMGGNWRLKGWHVLLRALSGILHIAWTCIAVGERSAEAALQAEREGLQGRVLVAPNQDVRPLLGAADLLVAPTYRDPCSLATLEALASGVPVLTTTANGAADAIRKDGAGTVIPSGDAGELAGALGVWVDALSDPMFRVRARREAREASNDRERGPWLDRLVDSLEAVAAEKAGTVVHRAPEAAPAESATSPGAAEPEPAPPATDDSPSATGGPHDEDDESATTAA